MSVSTTIRAFGTDGISPHREGSIAASQKIVNYRESRPRVVRARPDPEGVEMRYNIIYSKSAGPNYRIYKSSNTCLAGLSSVLARESISKLSHVPNTNSYTIYYLAKSF